MKTGLRVLCVSDRRETPGRIDGAVERHLPDAAVVVASDPDAALEAVEDGEIDCIVCEYDLSGTTGVDLLVAVREVAPSVPFVLWPADGDEHIASEAVEAGVTEYLPSDGLDAPGERLAAAVSRGVNRTRTGPHHRYKTILEAMGDGVYALDREGNFTEVNDTLTEMTGYDRERLLGEHISIIMDERDVSAGTRLIETLYDSEERSVGKLEMDVHTADGDVISCENRIALLPDGDDIDGTVGVLRSVAEHERMKAELREEKRKIAELHEVAAEMESCESSDAVYRLAVDAAEEILEFDICGIDIAEDGVLVPRATSTEMPTDGYEPLDVTEGLAGRTYQNSESFVIEDVRVMQEAEPVQQEYRSILSVPVGDVGVFQAGSRDTGAFTQDDLELAELLMSHVTEVVARIESQSALRESEEKYRTLVEGSHDAIYIYAGDEFKFVNERVCELTGYDKAELYEMEIWELLHPDEVERVKSLIRNRTESDISPHYETRVLTKDGDIRHMEMSVRPLTYEGEVAQLGSARDVTERKERKQEIKRQNERLKEFASVVSHDLRNPLNVAQGHLELARETGESVHFEKAAGALVRMDNLIEDLLALARQGQDVHDTESVAIDAVAPQAWETVETADATLEVEDSSVVEADCGRLLELFENLFRNAIEHASESVTVRVGGLDHGTGFYVADDGPGIPAEKRENVFEHGYTTQQDGSGLGLSIVKNIADAHGWSVRVAGNEAGGARFEFHGT